MIPLLLAFLTLAQAPVPSPVRTGTATGLVRTSDGKPATGVRVALMAAPDNPGDAGMAFLLAIVQTDETGRFRLEDVPAGQYYIVAGQVAMPTFYPGVTSLTGATRVTIRSGEVVSGLDFVVMDESTRAVPAQVVFSGTYSPASSFPKGLAPTVEASGMVVVEGGLLTAPVPAKIRVTRVWSVAERAHGNVTLTRGPTTIIVNVDRDGSFKTDLPSGDYRISVDSARYTARSIRSAGLRGVDLRSQLLHVVSAQGPVGIRITIAPTVP